MNKDQETQNSEKTMDSQLERYEHLGGIRQLLLFFMVAMVQIMVQVTLSQVPLLPLPGFFHIEENLGKQSWLALSMPLTTAAFMLPAGKLGDLYTYKRLIVIGYAIVGFGALMVGFTGYVENLVYFSIFRGVTGIGFACTLPNFLLLANTIYPATSFKRLIMMVTFSTSAMIGFFGGLMVSAVVAERIWWPWAFWIAAIIAILLSIANYLIIPDGVDTYCTERVPFDFIGTALYSPSIIILVAMMVQGAAAGWKQNPYTYIIFIVGCLLFGACMIYEIKFCKYPLIHRGIFTSETAFVLLCMLCGWAGFGIWLFNTGRFDQLIVGSTPVVAALHYLPVIPSGIISVTLAIISLQKLPVPLLMLVSLCSFLVSNILVGTRPVHQTYWAQNFISVIILPFAIDFSLPTGGIILLSLVPNTEVGAASSIVLTAAFLAVTIGFAIGTNAEVYTTIGKPQSIETLTQAIRNSFHVAFAINGLGVIVAFIFVIYSLAYLKKYSSPTQSSEKNQIV